ncbi:HesB/YadR/YfhF family protein [Mesobacillus jeotgali]|uniref:HesB/YadR/YfhF family protein n=1 Tax=Mesobacillus jeotgali TaxID=129985 RepID=UPI000C848BE0|nr:HesB/YadR/YfhF family protein [Mesobacillus jeotgali]
MNITINDDAAAWYENEMDLSSGSFLRFFVRYGGFSSIQKGFSLGVAKEDETHTIGVQTVKNGVTYYIEEKDLWYFDGHDLFICLNKVSGEPEFEYK